MDEPTVSPEDHEMALGFIRTHFPVSETDPLIDLPKIAMLAGVAKNTPMIWRQRSRPEYKGPGKLSGTGRRKPFPEPDDERYADKPQWRLTTVVGWLIDTNRWPRGAVARPETRGPRSEAA